MAWTKNQDLLTKLENFNTMSLTELHNESISSDVISTLNQATNYMKSLYSEKAVSGGRVVKTRIKSKNVTEDTLELVERISQESYKLKEKIDWLRGDLISLIFEE